MTASAVGHRTMSWNGVELLEALGVAAQWLDRHAAEVNALNVFPVPDGDTGTNMSLTLSGAIKDVAPDESCAVVAEKVKYWAMMRGRGNSGIILSQILRGVAQGLSGYQRMGAAELAAALAQASASAYRAVLKPVEGTMLTVVREASEAAAAALTARDINLAEVLEAAVRGARESVDRTPMLLKTLRDAGVVDAGGQGLFLILEGMLHYARGESIEYDAGDQAVAIAFDDIHGPDDFGYCTNFIIRGEAMPFDEIRAALAAMGQSVVVVGDDALIKVHVHLLRPGDALNYAVGFGALEQIEITNMDLQREDLHHARSEERGLRSEEKGLRAEGRELRTEEKGLRTESMTDGATRSPQSSSLSTSSSPQSSSLSTTVGVVAVAPGPGFERIFRSLHAGAVVTGGQTMNPSTEDLLEAIRHVPQREVIVLPNNSNVIMAARQTANLSDKRIEVLPTRTAPQGIAALVGFNYEAGLEENLRMMTAAIGQVHTAEITRAVRDASIDQVAVRAGQTIGLLDGDLVAANDASDPVVDDLLGRMELGEREIVTIYYGTSVGSTDAEALAERVRERFANLDVEVQEGGQPLYDYIISAE